MAKQTGLTILLVVLLTTTVKINGGNRYKSITSTCCQKGGDIYASTQSPTPSSSPSETPLAVALVAPPLPAKSRRVINNRGGGLQLEVTAAP